jgi:hypothetical protein
VSTTNENWEVEFMDRTKEEEAKKPLHKILVIQNFGIYYKPNDVMFISELDCEETRIE